MTAAASTRGLFSLCPPSLPSSLPHLLPPCPLFPVPALSPGLELCDPTQRLRVALAGELVGVGGHFLFLGLALVSKDWRFLQRMITAPCILFLFYGSVPPSTCCLAIPISTSSLALAQILHCPSPRPAPALPPRGGPFPSLGQETGGLTVHPQPPCPQLAWSVSGVCTVADSKATD